MDTVNAHAWCSYILLEISRNKKQRDINCHLFTPFIIQMPFHIVFIVLSITSLGSKMCLTNDVYDEFNVQKKMTKCIDIISNKKFD